MPSMPDSAPEVNEQVLSDATRRGRQRPWRLKKLSSLFVARAFAAAGLRAEAARCRDCGTYLEFDECPQDGTKLLRNANFCKLRLCPMCAWRRSMRLSEKVSIVLHMAAEKHPEWSYVFLTLTQRNVPGERLLSEVDRVLKAWRKLTKHRQLRAVTGWFRAVEITRNRKRGEWHPHIHALLAVRPSYWANDYISQKRWCELWAESASLDYAPIIDVHKVRSRKNGDTLSAAAREAAKYTVKVKDIVRSNDKIEDAAKAVAYLHEAMYRRQLTAWGGELRRIAVAVEALDDQDEDLVHVGEAHGPNCPVCGTEMLPEIYSWFSGRRNYYRVAKPT